MPGPFDAPDIADIMDPVVYERIMKSLHHEEGDRLPIWDLIDNRATYDYFAPGEADPLKASVAVYNALGIDLCRGYMMPFAESDDGAVREHNGYTYRVTGRSHWVAERPFKSPADLRNISIAPISEEQIWQNDVPHYAAGREAFAPITMLVPGGGCGFHAAYGHVGTVLFMYAIHDEPDHARRLIFEFGRNAATRARVFAEANLCPIYFIGDDIAYKGALMFSLDFLRETFIPVLRACCEPLRNAGIKVIFHSDGYLMPILDDMIEAGINGLNPIEPLAGMDLAVLKKRYGEDLVLVGGIDCSQLLPLGTVGDIRRQVERAMEVAGRGGGFFIGSSSEIVPATPLENVLAFYDACREFGRYRSP